MESRMIKDLQFWKFSLYGFIKNLHFFDPFLILFFREMGISFFQIGILYSIRELATNITELPTGIIADSWGRRTAMILSFFCYIISFTLFYLSSHFAIYAVAMVAFAFGESFRSGTHKAMILEYITRKGIADLRVHYYGQTRSWSQRGSAVSALAAAFMVFFAGSYRTLFLWSIVPYILGMALIYSYPKNLDFSCDEEGCEEERPSRIESMRITVKNFFSLFKSGTIRRTLLNSSLFDAVFKSVKDYVQPVLKNLALAVPLFILLEGTQRVALMTGSIYFLLYMLTSLASSYSGRFSEKFSHKSSALNVTYLSGSFLVMGIGLFLLAGLRIPAVLLFICYYLIENLRRPATLGAVSSQIKGSVMATGLSGESQLKTLLVALFAPLFGYAVDTIGIGASMLFLSLVPLMAYPFIFFRRE